MTHELEFHIEPTPKGRPRFTRSGIAFTPKETREAETTLRYLMRAKWRGQPLESALRVEIVFTLTKPKSVKRLYPSVRCDVDNYAKLVLDCGNEIIWKDDSLIVDLHVRKEYGTPMIRMMVGEV
jgi:Holliday junction resolvase RusA-like endonuclease